MKALKVIKKITTFECYRCSGRGETKRENPNTGTKSSFVPCKLCRGSGKYRESTFYHIIKEKNGQLVCYDGDTYK